MLQMTNVGHNVDHSQMLEKTPLFTYYSALRLFTGFLIAALSASN